MGAQRVAAAPTPADGPADLGRSSVHGFLWTLLAWGTNRVVVLGLTLLLARLLVPADFGLVTAGLTVITFLDAALDLGVGASVVYEQERGVSARVRAAFTVTLVTSAAVSVLGIACSPLIAAAFGERQHWLVFALLFVYPLLRGGGQVNDAVLKRDLLFRRRTCVDVLRALVRVAVSLPLASGGHGAVSIAVGIVASELVAMLLLWTLAPIRPSRHVSRSELLSLVGFGGQVTVIRVLGSVRSNVDYLVVGGALGAGALGYYGIAYKLPELVVANVLWMFTVVAFPAYSQARARGLDVLNGAMLHATELVTLYGFCAGTSLAVLAPDAIPVLFSSRWAPAVTPMVLISLSLSWMAVGWASGDVFTALGRPGVLLAFDIPVTVAMTVALVVSPRWGLVGVAVVHLVVNVLYAFLRVVLAVRVTGVGARPMLGALVPGAVAGMAVAVVGLGVQRALDPGVLRLLVTSLACVAVSVTVGALTARPALRSVLVAARPARGGQVVARATPAVPAVGALS